MTPAAEEFSRLLKHWFRQNGWPQSITEAWARSTGCEIGPWASQISKAMSCQLDPKTNFFLALGRFNAAVEENAFAGVTDLKARKRLKDSQPLRADDGKLYTAADFFAVFAGLLEIPERYQKQEEEADSPDWDKLADLMKQFAHGKGVPSEKALELLAKKLGTQ